MKSTWRPFCPYWRRIAELWDTKCNLAKRRTSLVKLLYELIRNVSPTRSRGHRDVLAGRTISARSSRSSKSIDIIDK
jgi:hypothetical protein